MEQPTKYKAKTSKIIFTDGISFFFLKLAVSGFFTGPFLFLICVIVIIFQGFKLTFTGVILPLVFVMGIVSIPLILMGLFSLPFLIRRINKIKNIIEKGEIVKGTFIEHKHGYKKTVLYFSFTVMGEVYKNYLNVLVFKLPFNKGDVIDVCYNKDKPSEAFIAQLFADKIP